MKRLLSQLGAAKKWVFEWSIGYVANFRYTYAQDRQKFGGDNGEHHTSVCDDF
jgi:hypothetical protein